jgi:hypothetical protein
MEVMGPHRCVLCRLLTITLHRGHFVQLWLLLLFAQSNINHNISTYSTPYQQ